MLCHHKKTSLASIILLISLLSHFNLAMGSDAKLTPRTRLLVNMVTYIDRSYGFTIDLASDFSLSSEQGDVLFFQSPDRSGAVIVRPRPGLSLGTVQETLRNGFENEVIALDTTGAPETLELEGARGLAMEVEGTLQGQEVRGVLAGIFGENDQGYMILVGSVQAQWPVFRELALSMLQSFSVRPIQPGLQHERWQKRLVGRRLVHAEDYGTRYEGHVTIGEYHFCSDGTFFQRSAVTSSVSDGWGRYSNTALDKSHGTWQVRMENNVPHVVMHAKRDLDEIIPVAESAGYVLLNGIPYRFAENDLCN